MQQGRRLGYLNMASDTDFPLAVVRDRHMEKREGSAVFLSRLEISKSLCVPKGSES